MELKDNSIKGVYCHFDGYPEGVGKTLMKYYSKPPKLKELIELGPISALGYNTKYSDNSEQGTKDYHRWRNEEKVWSYFSSKDDYLHQTIHHLLEEYSYLLTLNGQWLVSSPDNALYSWINLNELI